MTLFPAWRVSTDGSRLYGFINASGAYIIKPQYAAAMPFGDGLAAVSVRGKYGFVNMAGELVIMPKYDGARRFVNSFCQVEMGGMRGCIDTEGREWVWHGYKICGDVHEGFIPVAKSPLCWAQLHVSGYEILDRNRSGEYFSEGVVPFGILDDRGQDRYGFKDKDERWVIPPLYDLAWSFSEGLAPVLLTHRGKQVAAFVDREGVERLRTPFYTTGNKFREGKVLVWDRIKGRHVAGFINRSGETVVPFRYQYAEDFSCGRALVKAGNLRGYVDSEGNEIVRPRYLAASSYDGGLALVRDQRGFAYLDLDGNEVWRE